MNWWLYARALMLLVAVMGSWFALAWWLEGEEFTWLGFRGFVDWLAGG